MDSKNMMIALVGLTLVASAAAVRPILAETSPALSLAGMVTKQLDICSLTQAPSMVLDVSQKGVCTLTTNLLANETAKGSKPTATGALQFTFPCKAASGADGPLNLEGPALNVWASSAPASAAAKADAGSGACTLTTLSPVLYFHRESPPLYHYGYSVGGLSCKQLGPHDPASPTSKDMISTATPGSGRMGVVYGLSLVPALPTPSMSKSPVKSDKFFSTSTQQCRLVVTAMGRAYMYQSTGTFPCAMVEEPEKKLGAGRCFGGAPAH